MDELKQWQGHRGKVLDLANGFEVIECELCGFKHIVPIPSSQELEVGYRREYYTKEKPLYLERMKEDLEWWRLVFSERYDSIEELLPHTRRRILDIGSGLGFFLLQGKQRGWEVQGVEPSRQAAAYSRSLGLEVMEDFFTENTAELLGCFDVVHISEVLEHIPDPISMLRIANRVLAEDGLLYVVVPNDYNSFQYALKKACGYSPWWLAPPYHINYFNFNSLSRLFSNTGFDVITQEATFPIDLFLLMGDNYVGNDALGRQCHAKRQLFEKNMAAAGLTHLKRKIYQAFAAAGCGREVLMLGRKKSES